jgi:hypothetical protein
VANPFQASDGYCPGTFYDEENHFDVVMTSTIKVKLDGEAISTAPAVQAVPDVGDWSLKGKASPDNDCSQPLKDEACSGDNAFKDSIAGAAAYARGRGHTIRFEMHIPEVPTETIKASDCDAAAGFAPPPAGGLFTAIAPYVGVGLSVPIEKLGRSKVFTGTAKALKVNKSYDLATCDHSSPCTASIASFVHKIKVQQLR